MGSSKKVTMTDSAQEYPLYDDDKSPTAQLRSSGECSPHSLPSSPRHLRRTVSNGVMKLSIRNHLQMKEGNYLKGTDIPVQALELQMVQLTMSRKRLKNVKHQSHKSARPQMKTWPGTLQPPVPDLNPLQQLLQQIKK